MARRISRRAVLGAASFIATRDATAQGDSWPNRPVKLMVAYPAGGSTDIVGRLLAERLSRVWGQPVIVENKGGAAGTLGADAVARATPDGYSLMLGASSELAIAPSTFRSLPYDPARDFEPISLLTLQPFLLLVTNALPVASVAELVAMAKAQPGKLNFGSFGTNTNTHLMGELLRVTTGADVTHIPYRGSAPAITDLIAGQIQFNFDTIPASLPHLADRRLRALALCHNRRLSSVPGIPTVAEAGSPALTGATWAMMVAPAQTPAPILRKVQADIAAVMQAGLAATLRERGLEPVGGSTSEARDFMAAEARKWAEVVRRANYRPE
jgi:tripartite-type tricarboxylate transporter receptor subunit TctC